VIGFDWTAALSAAGLALIDVNLWDALWHADLVGLGLVFVLVGYSVYCCGVIIRMRRGLNRIEKQNQDYLRACAKDGTLEGAFFEAKRFPDSVLANILRAAYLEIHGENWFNDVADLPIEQRLEFSRASIERAVERAINDQMQELDHGMIALGTSSSVAPFMGLFGTVWGTLAAFQAVANNPNADLQALAPGISTALVATIAGLIVAIPSTCAYNVFSTRIAKIVARMDSYGLDLRNVFQRETLRRTTAHVVAA